MIASILLQVSPSVKLLRLTIAQFLNPDTLPFPQFANQSDAADIFIIIIIFEEFCAVRKLIKLDQRLTTKLLLGLCT